MKIIGVDVDGVVASLLPVWLEDYNFDYMDKLRVEDITEWDLHKLVKPDCGMKIYEYIDKPDIYDDVKPIKGSLYAIRTLREWGFRVVFITACTTNTFGRKYKWLVQHGFLNPHQNRDYIEAVDKSLIATDYLIDDSPINIQTAKGKPIIFDAPYNGNVNCTRVKTWVDVMLYFAQVDSENPSVAWRME